MSLIQVTIPHRRQDCRVCPTCQVRTDCQGRDASLFGEVLNQASAPRVAAERGVRCAGVALIAPPGCQQQVGRAPAAPCWLGAMGCCARDLRGNLHGAEVCPGLWFYLGEMELGQARFARVSPRTCPRLTGQSAVWRRPTLEGWRRPSARPGRRARLRHDVSGWCTSRPPGHHCRSIA